MMIGNKGSDPVVYSPRRILSKQPRQHPDHNHETLSDDKNLSISSCRKTDTSSTRCARPIFSSRTHTYTRPQKNGTFKAKNMIGRVKETWKTTICFRSLGIRGSLELPYLSFIFLEKTCNLLILL